jgi:hypothetical protein
MGGRRRTLRELVAAVRLTPEEAEAARAGQCLEALYDQERCACHDLGEREEAAVEAERRHWEHQDSNRSETISATGL